MLVATDADGLPQVAVAAKIEALPDGRVAVFEWFRPETVSNLAKNPRLSLVVWDLSLTRAISSRGKWSR